MTQKSFQFVIKKQATYKQIKTRVLSHVMQKRSDFEKTQLLNSSVTFSSEAATGVLRNFANFTGKHLHESLFFNKVAGLRLWTPFSQNTSEQLLLFPVSFQFKRECRGVIRTLSNIYDKEFHENSQRLLSSTIFAKY